MIREIKVSDHPDKLNADWDKLSKWYYQKKEFLAFLHIYNHCNQQYYELYKDNVFVAATIVYSFKTNMLTFSSLNLFVNMKIIGLPISIATVPIIGDEEEYEFLLSEILNHEKGLILGLNFTANYLQNQVVNMNTLPTIVIDRRFENYDEYLKALRHPYRRRLLHLTEKFRQVRSEVTSCKSFTDFHYKLYLNVLKKSTTKLETLSFLLFINLPENFILTTHYIDNTMLAWNICNHDMQTTFFFMGGLNYEFRDFYQSYFNNMTAVLKSGFERHSIRFDLGQTADVAKMRMGGVESERFMFLYHKNKIILFIIRCCKRLFEYSKVQRKHHVFKKKV